MSPPVLVGLMVVAGLCHASWNLLAKTTTADRVLAIASLSAVMSLLCLPWAVTHPPTSWWPLAAVVVARALAQCVYAYGLSNAYAHADFSLAYPIARGTGPLVATGLSTLALGERPHPVGVAGIVLVSLGIISLTCTAPSRHRTGGARTGMAWAVLTGLTIGGYTVIDKVGVGSADPITYLCLSEGLVGLLFIGVYSSRGRARELRLLVELHGRRLLLAGVLAAAGYGFALVAMSHTYASYIAPLREISVIFGVVLAGLVLREANAVRRLPSALAVVAGVVLVGVAL